MTKHLTHSIFILTLLCVPFIAHAQLSLPNLGESLLVEITPNDIIEPNTEVSVRVDSFLLDLNQQAIAWFVDGKLVENNAGKKEVKVRVGEIGSETKVTVATEGPTGLVNDFTVILRPVELDLLWEADSYTPPFYRGRALGSPGANIVTQAEVRFIQSNGIRIAPTSIVYSWSMNGKTLGNESGRGKFSARIPITGLFGNDIVSVNAVSIDGKFHAKRVVRIPSVEPNIVLYKIHPLLGIDYRNAVLDQAVFSDSEITVAALPFFSKSTGPLDSGISYSWSVDNVSVPQDAKTPFLLTLSLAEQAFGATTIGVFVDNVYNILQGSEKKWFVGLNTNTQSVSDIFVQ
jgi:hypothetical protein